MPDRDCRSFTRLPLSALYSISPLFLVCYGLDFLPLLNENMSSSRCTKFPRKEGAKRQYGHEVKSKFLTNFNIERNDALKC